MSHLPSPATPTGYPLPESDNRRGNPSEVNHLTQQSISYPQYDNQVQIEEPGETLVPADKLRDIVRESVDDTLSIEVVADNANIRGQDSHFKIFTQRPADFPAIPDFDGEANFEIAGGLLKQLI